MHTATFFRRLLPAMLLTSLALASCECRKDHDPRPNKGKCGSTAPSTTTPPPGGNS
ncbi:hypothetical protein [Hymenobacter negativus]|uniref:Lipoprotein n=1 Tax=Hymenobacter negativus TaxID=2795026 RepID=A0ABS0Q9G4_9BACT|nr:hypothetical protein [Hymenobacter negativus]MBH8558849.1 hypothetical protein [Hymenobacter negativus]